mgnify:CR=1 FL=1
MAHFFIERPVFAWVISLFIMVAGALAITQLPVAQYPEIAPPSIVISATYPGASAETLDESVTSLIEQELNGIEGLLYIESSSEANGTAQITATFVFGTDPDMAQVEVQNRLKAVEPRLPEQVTRQGLQVRKSRSNFLLMATLSSTDGSLSRVELGDYISRNIIEDIKRVPGVGQATLFGTQQAMRIWIQPDKLVGLELTPADVIAAIRTQNAQVAAGSLGAQPSAVGQQIVQPVMVTGQLSTPEEFGSILLRSNPDGSTVRLRDVARIELGGENYMFGTRLDGSPNAAIGVQLSPTGNALATAKAVRAKLEELSRYFPDNIEYAIPYDTSQFVKISIEGVVKTLIEAVVLVFLVMFLFLQNFRATLIPTIAVPVVLLGTFGMLAALGLSINMLTMFAMVLAIGLLVDDAIVVVENVERIMQEEGLPPKEATRKSMDQISGALVGIGLVISAVFVPMAFFGGSTGVIYRQFSITIVSAMTFSVIVALIFTPALCATMLKPIKPGESHEKKGFFGWFNRWFNRNAGRYQGGVRYILKRRARFMVVYLLIIGAAAIMFRVLPTAFLPDEDQGVMSVMVQLPPNSSAERTEAVLAEVRDYLLNEESDTVAGVMAIRGFNFAGRGQNSGMIFVDIKPFEERTEPHQSVFALADRAGARFAQIKDATVFPIVPPAILELGNATGFDLYLKDNAGVGHEALMAAMGEFLEKANQDPMLQMVRHNGLPDEPQYQVLIDDEKARTLQVSLEEINNTMSIAWGSAYVNDFIDRGRVKRVYVQGNMESRLAPEDFDKWYVRNAQGEMVPFSAFATGEWIYGSPRLQRYEGVPAVQIQGAPAPGYSTGEAMVALERIAAELPPGVGLEYTGLSYEERQAGDQAMALYALSIMIVFLCLVALYESWSIPF